MVLAPGTRCCSIDADAASHVADFKIVSLARTALTPKDRLLTARWPITALAPEDTVVTVDGSAAAVSTDES